MTNHHNISINDYDYDLPEEKIALHPLVKRDASKLLVYRNGEISETTFWDIGDNLPAGTLLVFNDTKVINARIKFKKPSGTTIEIFCLEPAGTVKEYSSVMSATKSARWKCFVGGATKWKEEVLEKELFINNEKVILKAAKLEKQSDHFIIEFSWQPELLSFAEIISVAGNTPLPPYIKRETKTEDTTRYQTVFAQHEGSVAAPTAGLHFSKELLAGIAGKHIESEFVTLHVGAGTFKPVKAQTMQEHEMHSEYIDVEMGTIKNIRDNLGNITAVGTTSLRTLESLYWLGVKVAADPSLTDPAVGQWDVYEETLLKNQLPAKKALDALLNWLQANGKKNIFTKTQLIILPGYKFRMVNLLITNFHQPRSTLLLLVAAAVGEDWKKIYRYASENNFRFLSYGDGSLIFI